MQLQYSMVGFSNQHDIVPILQSAVTKKLKKCANCRLCVLHCQFAVCFISQMQAMSRSTVHCSHSDLTTSLCWDRWWELWSHQLLSDSESEDKQTPTNHVRVILYDPYNHEATITPGNKSLWAFWLWFATKSFAYKTNHLLTELQNLILDLSAVLLVQSHVQVC